MRWNDDDLLDDGARVRHLPGREVLRRVAPLVRPHLRSFALGVALLAVSIAAEIGGPLVLRHLIDVDIGTAVSGGAAGGGSRGGIIRSALLYALLFVIGTAAGYLQIVILARTGLEIVSRLKRDLFHHVLGLSLDYFDRNSPGRLLSRIESDAERLQALFSDVAVSVLRTFVLLGGALAVMFATNWRVTVAIVLFALPIATGTIFYFRWLRGLYRRVRVMVARISGFVSEYVQAVPILQTYGYEGEARRRLAALNQDKLEVERRSSFYEYGFWGLLGALEVAAVVLLLHVGTGRVAGAALTVGTLVLFVEYTRRIFQPLARFSEQLGFIQRAFASADRVFAVLDTPSRTPDRPGASETVPPDWHEVAFDDVSFVYDGGTRALDRVSFRIRRGERVALVGPSGGGKTTITNLLLRFHDPSEGRIALDGTDIRDYEVRAWRARIGLVLQDIHLFPGTVGENLRALVDDVDPARVERALQTVGADEVVARLPRGTEEPLSEGGANLSMGERQLLSFARALVPEPDLLILDEATSSVDPGTERRLQASMDLLLAGRTALVIAHRLATVVNADRILVVHRGRLVEEGTHADLYARRGIYRDLFDLQFRSGAGA